MLFFRSKCLAVSRIKNLWFIVMALLLVLFAVLDYWWNESRWFLRLCTLG
jgi:hypothetical protein